jgi:hypothetical protein
MNALPFPRRATHRARDQNGIKGCVRHPRTTRYAPARNLSQALLMRLKPLPGCADMPARGGEFIPHTAGGRRRVKPHSQTRLRSQSAENASGLRKCFSG